MLLLVTRWCGETESETRWKQELPGAVRTNTLVRWSRWLDHKTHTCYHHYHHFIITIRHIDMVILEITQRHQHLLLLTTTTNLLDKILMIKSPSSSHRVKVIKTVSLIDCNDPWSNVLDTCKTVRRSCQSNMGSITASFAWSSSPDITTFPATTRGLSFCWNKRVLRSCLQTILVTNYRPQQKQW